MIPRYTLRQMGALWSDESRWQHWLKIEILACEALAHLGNIPSKDVAVIKKKAKIIPEKISALEAEVKHDVIAFVSSVAATVGPEGRHLHWGLTSSDVLDTAFACQLKAAAELLENRLKVLLQILEKKAIQYKKTPMIGRTHGIHAEPVTFGLKLAGWLAEFRRQQERLQFAKEEISAGKISGAVGTYAHISPEVEEYVLSKLGLVSEVVSTQVVSRDRHAFFFSVLAGIAGTVERVALEIRHLARTEVGEVLEPFGKQQKGSSAMPHKKNPILTENLTGLARLVRANVIPALENMALWHERDISHSSVERVIAPDTTIALDFMLDRLTYVIRDMAVQPKKMLANLESSKGLIYSQEVLLALVEKGLSRDQAYRIVQKHALKAWENGESFEEKIAKDPMVQKKLSKQELKSLFDWKRQLKHVDQIIKRTLSTK